MQPPQRRPVQGEPPFVVLAQQGPSPFGHLLLVESAPVLVDQGYLHALEHGARRPLAGGVGEAGPQRRVPGRHRRPGAAEEVGIDVPGDVEKDLCVKKAGSFSVAGLEENPLLGGRRRAGSLHLPVFREDREVFCRVTRSTQDHNPLES